MTDPNTDQQPIANTNTNNNDDTAAMNLFLSSSSSSSSSIDGQGSPQQPKQKIIGTSVVKPSPQDNSPIFTSSCTGQMTEKDARIIYQILVESKSLTTSITTTTTATTTANFSSLYNLEEEVDQAHKKEKDEKKVEALKKITISFSSVQYSCCVDNKGIVYMLKCATA